MRVPSDRKESNISGTYIDTVGDDLIRLESSMLVMKYTCHQVCAFHIYFFINKSFFLRENSIDGCLVYCGQH